MEFFGAGLERQMGSRQTAGEEGVVVVDWVGSAAWAGLETKSVAVA